MLLGIVPEPLIRQLGRLELRLECAVFRCEFTDPRPLCLHLALQFRDMVPCGCQLLLQQGTVLLLKRCLLTGRGMMLAIVFLLAGIVAVFPFARSLPWINGLSAQLA